MLQQIVHQLDAELERLQAIRDIVAGLQSAPLLTEVTLSDLSPEPEAGPPQETAPTLRKSTQRRRSIATTTSVPEKRSEKKQSPEELRALKSSIPAGPVVVSAQGLARERENRAATKAVAVLQIKAPEADTAALDALSRNLANRWRVGTDSASHT